MYQGTPIAIHNPNALSQAWRGIEMAKPGIRIQEAAQSLQTSEAQLLATKVGIGANRLSGDWARLWERLPELGIVTSITRNEACTIEHKGAFEKVTTFGQGDHQMATVNGAIETRVFYQDWYVAFAVKQKRENRTEFSIQVFDKAGQAITKIVLLPESNHEAFQKIVTDYTSENQGRSQKVYPAFRSQTVHDADRQKLLDDWSQLTDSHNFFPMLAKHKVKRMQALRMAEGVYSYRILPTLLESILHQAAQLKIELMIFSGNQSNVQIHHDPVKTIRITEYCHQRWLNVLDGNFSMHLRMDLIDSLWVVNKPTTNGEFTSLEAYDNQGELIVQLFGMPQQDGQELSTWNDLAHAFKN